MANAKYYVKEIVRPNYLTGKIEREKLKPSISKDKSKSKKQPKVKKTGKLLKSPSAKVLSKIDPVQTTMKGKEEKTKFVKEGEEGFFKKEYIKERQNFLGGYSL